MATVKFNNTACLPVGLILMSPRQFAIISLRMSMILIACFNCALACCINTYKDCCKYFRKRIINFLISRAVYSLAWDEPQGSICNHHISKHEIWGWRFSARIVNPITVSLSRSGQKYKSSLELLMLFWKTSEIKDRADPCHTNSSDIEWLHLKT